MTQLICIHCYVSGRVQGVWFRAETTKEAKRLDLTGWVRNLPDGRVEVFACGDVENIKKFQSWLKKGPPLATVSDVSYEEVEFEEHEEFRVL